MLELVQFYGTLAILAVLAILSWSWIVWPFIKAKWGASMPAIATTAGDKVAALIDQGAMLIALQDVMALARKRQDAVILDLCAKIRLESAKWDDPQNAQVSAPSDINAIIADAVAKVQEAAK